MRLWVIFITLLVRRDIHEDKEVLTINATTSQVFLGDLGTAGYVAWFQVDPATNAITITTGTRSCQVRPTRCFQQGSPLQIRAIPLNGRVQLLPTILMTLLQKPSE